MMKFILDEMKKHTQVKRLLVVAMLATAAVASAGPVTLMSDDFSGHTKFANLSTGGYTVTPTGLARAPMFYANTPPYTPIDSGDMAGTYFYTWSGDPMELDERAAVKNLASPYTLLGGNTVTLTGVVKPEGFRVAGGLSLLAGSDTYTIEYDPWGWHMFAFQNGTQIGVVNGVNPQSGANTVTWDLKMDAAASGVTFSYRDHAGGSWSSFLTGGSPVTNVTGMGLEARNVGLPGGSGDSSFYYDTLNLTATVIPEPTALAIILTGSALVFRRRVRRA